MKTLEQIKDEVAIEFGYKDFEEMNNDPKRLPVHSLMKRYAAEAIKADRERIANNATLLIKINATKEVLPKRVKQWVSALDTVSVDKESIINLTIELP